MKTLLFRKTTLRIVLATLWLASDYSVQFSKAQAQPAPPAPTTADAAAARPPSVTPPPSILPNSPLAQVIKLVQAGVDDSVIMSYVSNSTSTFNLDPDKIIYLSDLGVPNEVVTAMMQRDQVLQQQMATSTPPPPPPPETPPAEPTEPPPPPPEPAEITVNYFYSSLAPYGTWVNVEGYGRCWRPTIVVYNSGWQPYCDRGHWVYTDCGWYWVSDYSWGITFHYGRWFRHPHWGWCWWPDTVWAPSWVTWRYSDDYCGWAPLPPFAVYRPGVGFLYRGSGVSIGFDFGLAINCFTFVPTRYFCDPRPHRHRIEARDEPRIYNQTTVINNFNFDSHNRTVINNGIGVQRITEATRTPIHPVPASELRAASERPWRGGPAGQQNRGPTATTGNPPHPGPAFDNRNNARPQNEALEPNRFSRPVNNQNLQPNLNVTPPRQSPTGFPAQNRFSRPVNNEELQPNQVRPSPGQPPTGSPTQNRSPQPANNQNPPVNYTAPAPAQPPAGERDNKHIASPRGQQFEEQTPHFTPPPSPAPRERPQGYNDSRPNATEPSPQNVAPSAPPSSPTSHSSPSSQSSQSSNRSGNQDQNQGGRGH
jgi:hypothetical protein